MGCHVCHACMHQHSKLQCQELSTQGYASIMGVCFPTDSTRQASLVKMYTKTHSKTVSGFQPLFLMGRRYFFWPSQGRLNWAPGAVLAQRRLSDSSSRDWRPQGYTTTSAIFPGWHCICRKKNETRPLHISEALEVPIFTATNSASSSVTHSQLPCKGTEYEMDKGRWS